MKLKCIDLFTGLGGLHDALGDMFEPILLCDNDPMCQNILSHKAHPKSAIVGDIKHLSLKDVEGQVDMLIASSPCQGFSSSGMMKGLSDDRSNLLLEVLRLADECKPWAIFMENVPGVIGHAMHVIAESLVEERKYELRWVCLPASHVGAPHMRYRWFCLATLPGVEWRWEGLAYKKFDWTTSPPRHVPFETPDVRLRNNHRLARLGNSVVPDCVRWAFFYLMNGFAELDIESDQLVLREPS
jgi:DNA (cytosine-5)-methyltransferase 1